MSDTTNETENRPEPGFSAHPTFDPKPPGPNATTEEKRDYISQLHQYVNDWCSRYDSIFMKNAELVWSDFI